MKNKIQNGVLEQDTSHTLHFNSVPSPPLSSHLTQSRPHYERPRAAAWPIASPSHHKQRQSRPNTAPPHTVPCTPLTFHPPSVRQSPRHHPNHFPSSAAESSSSIQSAFPRSADAGKELVVSSPSSARFTPSALPRGYLSLLPALATTTLLEASMTGSDSEMDDEAGLTTDTTSFSLSAVAGVSGYSEPMWPSVPIPMRERSNMGTPSALGGHTSEGRLLRALAYASSSLTASVDPVSLMTLRPCSSQLFRNRL
mmetsp:Transcript_48072/g.116799  ORF Transcript_48072/g.116799 Transcript_48072/m.116799 type:complete len:254 (-) Transcript_48072:489-1250(-)